MAAARAAKTSVGGKHEAFRGVIDFRVQKGQSPDIRLVTINTINILNTLV